MQFWPFFAGAAIAALAVAAATHAVITKRNVGTAVAWVGLILFSPLVGALLYGLLGINRIRRRATQLRSETPRFEASRGEARPVETLVETALPPDRHHLVDIARLGDRTANRPLLPGNRVTPLIGGDVAYPAMVEAIRKAERTVTLTTYIFDNDVAGHAFLDALAAAVGRGVAVRVLIDDVGARYSFPPMVRLLRRAGVRTARFNPAILHWRMPYFNLRSHRKILVVDGRIGFTGGMNIRAGTWLSTDPSHPIRDLHFHLEGPVVVELQEVFAEDWAFSTRERLRGDAWFPPLEPVGSTVARGISNGPDIDFQNLTTIIMGAISSARRSVRIVTPYFIPEPTLKTLLILAAMRGVQVEILTPEKNNLALVQWASEAHWGPLLEGGCRIHLTPPPFDHAKLMLVDDAWVLLGSANLDPRSLQLNFEFNVECYDVDLARKLDAVVAERRAGAREVTLEEVRRRPLRVKLRNGIAWLASPYL